MFIADHLPELTSGKEMVQIKLLGSFFLKKKKKNHAFFILLFEHRYNFFSFSFFGGGSLRGNDAQQKWRTGAGRLRR